MQYPLEVIEEVLREVGLERLEPEPHWTPGR